MPLPLCSRIKLMQYALLHRFQATLLGAVLGETIGLHPLQHLNRKSLPKLQWAAVTRFYTQQFLQHNRFDAAEFCEKLMPKTAGETTIALLPVALFFHEDRLKLRQMLNQVAEQHSAIAQPPSFAVGCAIAEALQEKLDPLTLIPTIITDLQSQSRDETASIDQLEQVQKLLNEQAGLETALDRLTSNSDHDATIGLAFYCFLSTPHDLRLALLRAAQTGGRSSIVGALTGALSGAFNSMSGIPIEWQLALDSWEAPSEQIVTQSDLLEMANRLLASWSGVYNPLTSSKEFRQVAAIAAPQVIRKAM